MLDNRELFIIIGYSISGSFILALLKRIYYVFVVFKYNLFTFNHVERLSNSWLRDVIILCMSFPCIKTLVSSAYRTVKSISDALHIIHVNTR